MVKKTVNNILSVIFVIAVILSSLVVNSYAKPLSPADGNLDENNKISASASDNDDFIYTFDCKEVYSAIKNNSISLLTFDAVFNGNPKKFEIRAHKSGETFILEIFRKDVGSDNFSQIFCNDEEKEVLRNSFTYNSNQGKFVIKIKNNSLVVGDGSDNKDMEWIESIFNASNAEFPKVKPIGYEKKDTEVSEQITNETKKSKETKESKSAEQPSNDNSPEEKEKKAEKNKAKDEKEKSEKRKKIIIKPITKLLIILAIIFVIILIITIIILIKKLIKKKDNKVSIPKPDNAVNDDTKDLAKKGNLSEKIDGSHDKAKNLKVGSLFSNVESTRKDELIKALESIESGLYNPIVYKYKSDFPNDITCQADADKKIFDATRVKTESYEELYNTQGNTTFPDGSAGVIVSNNYDLLVNEELAPLFEVCRQTETDLIMVNEKYIYLNFNKYSGNYFCAYPSIQCLFKCFDVVDSFDRPVNADSQKIERIEPCVVAYEDNKYHIVSKGKIIIKEI